MGSLGAMSDPLSWLRAPCVMGILNATPDSLWGGSGALEPAAAMERLDRMVRDGAAICDVGAESTRPGSEPVGAAEQLARLDGVLRAVRENPPAIALSVDTSLASVAAAALDAGAVLVNDVTAGRGDPDLLPLVAERGAGICLVHMRGDPRTMQADPRYADVVGEVAAFLQERAAFAIARGVAPERIQVDPGIGFGKTLEHNLELLRRLDEIAALGFPVVVGVSRKSFLGALTGRQAPASRVAATVAANVLAFERGGRIFRVHDVAATVDALKVATASLRADG